jgi:hypothetical protein
VVVIYRLYFNRCEDWPQIWSIDSGDASTECNVVDFRLEHGVTATAGRAADFKAIDATREPKAWVAVNAHSLRIENGVSVFEDALANA